MLMPIVLAAVTALAIPPATNAVASPALQELAAKTAPAKAEQPWPPAGVFRPGGGVRAPKVAKEVRVSYTPDALRAKVQGGVALEAVVRADGTVGEVRVVRSLDKRYGLDDEAVWRRNVAGRSPSHQARENSDSIHPRFQIYRLVRSSCRSGRSSSPR